MKINVARVLDEGRWSGYQKFLIAATALTIILDGIDNQLLGTAIPNMIKDWSVKAASLSRNDFSAALAMSPLGMLFGGALGGWLGDRIGRRTALLTSVLLFALPTALIFFTNDMAQWGLFGFLSAHGFGGPIPELAALSLFRFLAGLGLGGAMPNAAALASEYVPRRQRPFAVTLTIVCVPLGATLAAETSAHIIPVLGWAQFFLWGGLIPLVLGGLLFFILPESPRYMAGKRNRWPELRVLLRKIGIDVPPDAEFSSEDAAPTVAQSSGNDVVDYSGVGVISKRTNSIAALFAPALRWDTLALFGTFFFGLLVAYLTLQLFVTALVGVGFSPFDARRTLFWWNVGGVCGALVGALLIQRLGSRTTMLGLSVIAIVASFSLAALPLSSPKALSSTPTATRAVTAPPVSVGPAIAAAPASRSSMAAAASAPAPAGPRLSLASPVGMAMIVLSILMGAAFNAVQVAMYALAAHVYPTEIRGTGLGVTVAVGRVGNVLASYIGNFALDFGISAYFATSGIGMILVFVMLALVRGHIGRHHSASHPTFAKTAAAK